MPPAFIIIGIRHCSHLSLSYAFTIHRWPSLSLLLFVVVVHLSFLSQFTVTRHPPPAFIIIVIIIVRLLNFPSLIITSSSPFFVTFNHRLCLSSLFLALSTIAFLECFVVIFHYCCSSPSFIAISPQHKSSPPFVVVTHRHQ